MRGRSLGFLHFQKLSQLQLFHFCFIILHLSAYVTLFPHFFCRPSIIYVCTIWYSKIYGFTWFAGFFFTSMISEHVSPISMNKSYKILQLWFSIETSASFSRHLSDTSNLHSWVIFQLTLLLLQMCQMLSASRIHIQFGNFFCLFSNSSSILSLALIA